LKALSYLKYQDVRLKQFIEKHNGMKLRVIGNSVFKKPNDEELLLQIPSRRYEITNKEDIPETLNQIATDIEIQIDRMEVSASGLILKKIEKLVFHYDKYNPTRGGSFIELPKWVQSKKACINIQNEDDMCLKYSVQCGVYKIYENDHACKVSHYKKIDDKILNWEGVKFPSSNLDIERLEENNPEIISVNVYHISSELNDNSILLYRKTKVAKSKYHIDLLKLEEGNKSHYVCIKNYDRLIGSQTNKMKAKKFHCKNCLHGFGSEVLLKKHYENGCMAVEGQQIQMAKEDDKMFFKNHYKKLKAPFVIYADFECLTTHHEKDKNKNTKTEYYQHHRPCGFMINVINSIDGSSEPFLYRGEDCMDVFTDKMIEVKNKIMDKMKENKPMIFNNNNQIDFNNATKCFICGKDFQACDVKVRDHCHFTGRYRGCAHQDCNLAFSMRYYKIPVFLHNLKNYDAHLIIERANKLSENAKIDVIAQNSERFITFGFKNLCFKDSFSFLSSSLDKLVKLSKFEDNIKRDKWENNFKFSKRNPYVNNLEDLDLLTDKGVYPYDYFDCFEKFDERQLPLKKDFYSKLSQTNIEASEYERAKHIWEHFGIRTLGQYHDLYLKN